MAGIAPTTRAEFNQRRKSLRRQRRTQRWQSFARLAIVSSFAGAALWSLRQPVWVIRDANQLRIENNQFLSDQTLRNLVPIKYPQSIFRTQPSTIAATLKRQAPLSSVQVDRQLFPPELIIRVQEQTPVAAVYSKMQKGGQPSAQPDSLLDAQGQIIPIERYQNLEQGVQLPALKVIGDPQDYRREWGEIYRAIQQSPLTIQQIDWRDSGNLILTSAIGRIHCGPYNRATFTLQLRAIGALKTLTKSIPSNRIDYIDLRNPNSPAVQKIATEPSPKPPTPELDAP
jgi:cell division protein FtsQ